MSHDSTKDLTFNQKYAGRSRVRRDLNTIKRDVVYAYAGTASGLTQYSLSERMGGTMNVGYVQFGPGWGGTTIGTGPEKDRTWASMNSGLNHQICLWRGPRDSYGATDTSASHGTVFIHKIVMYQPYSGTDANALFDNTGNVDITVGPGGFLASTADDDGLIDGTIRVSADTFFTPTSDTQTGQILENQEACVWTDNDDRGDGAVPASGGYIAGTGSTGTDTEGDGSGFSVHQHGLWLRFLLGSGDIADWDTGKLEFYVFYSLMPN